MMRRCYEANHHAYNRYGARGIFVCDRWHIFLNFQKDLVSRPIGMTLDRIDNDREYSPDNCRWATKSQQAQNRSKKTKKSSALITLDVNQVGSN